MNSERGQAEAVLVFGVMLLLGVMCLYLGIAKPKEIENPGTLIFVGCAILAVIGLPILAALCDRKH